jgi:hypothetical protein
MRQLVYVSTSNVLNTEEALAAILQQSRHNNAIYGVTGLLWAGADRFLQVLEGPTASIRETYQRIETDDRHRDLIILHDQRIEDREFGDWSMAYRRSQDKDGDCEGRISRLLSSATRTTHSIFGDFIGREPQ